MKRTNYEIIENGLWYRLRSRLWDRPGGRLEYWMWDRLWDQLSDRFGYRLWDRLLDRLEDKLEGCK